jgi:hypothetical protein
VTLGQQMRFAGIDFRFNASRQAPFSLRRICQRIVNLTARHPTYSLSDAEVVDIRIDGAGDMITVRVSADVSPLFPDFGLSLDHTVVREGERICEQLCSQKE